MSARVPALPAVLAALVALVLGAVLAPLAPWADRDPGEGSAEAGFARDMQVHHAQAVAMSAMAFDRSTDEEVRAVALDMATSQQAQIGSMSAWLEEWDLPRRGDAPQMAWMGGDHAEHARGLMPGMATRAEMAALAEARGPEFDLLWATLMHAHHAGGLPMAEQVLARTDREPVRALAASMRDSQAAELEVLEDIAARVGGAPLDAEEHAHH